MDFTLNAEQTSLLTALDDIAKRFERAPDHESYAIDGRALDAELESMRFFEGVYDPLSAALAVERLARLPYPVEAALSLLVRPQLPGTWPRPLAIVEHGRPGRFVANARTILVIDGDAIGLVQPAPGDIERVDSLFAYPMGRLKPNVKTTPVPDAAIIRKWIRIALAAEVAGLLQATVAATIDHLTNRQQFGRPLGTFQALRHRMAECAVLAGGVRLLALKAAWTGNESDAALAAYYAQDSATRVAYDVHQMHGGIGITLERPLHLWTYRLKALVSELGGRGGQAQAVAQYSFGAAP